MCGIIAFIPKDPKYKKSGKRVAEQYQLQSARGTRGFGLINITAKGYEIDRAVEPIKALMDCYDNNSPIKTFHHRMPTSTDNEIRQTHPFRITHGELAYDWLIVHNGVIRNTDVLYKEHVEELGYAYSTFTPPANSYQSSAYKRFNDSETLAIEIARYFEGREAQIRAIGTIAFIAYKIDKKTGQPLEMLWGRNDGNPLELVETKDGILLASTVYDDDAEIITANTYEVLDLKKYFATKEPHKSIIKMIKAGPIDFYVEPPKPVVTQTIPTPSKNTMGYGAQASQTASKLLGAGKDDERELDLEDDSSFGYQTPREAAFQKMAERVIDDISEEIMDFCMQLAYSKMTEDEILDVAAKLQDLLIEKAERADSYVRPHFDRREEEEEALTAARAYASEPTFDDMFPDDNDGPRPNSYLPSLQDRIDEHDERWERMMD